VGARSTDVLAGPAALFQVMGQLVESAFASLDAHVEPLGLTYRWWRALVATSYGAHAPASVAREVGLSTDTTTKLIDELEGHRLIVRTRCRVDRRIARRSSPGMERQLVLVRPWRFSLLQTLYLNNLIKKRSASSLEKYGDLSSSP